MGLFSIWPPQVYTDQPADKENNKVYNLSLKDHSQQPSAIPFLKDQSLAILFQDHSHQPHLFLKITALQFYFRTTASATTI